MNHKPIFSLLFIICCLTALGQEKTVKTPHRFWDIKLHAGGHLYTGESLSEALNDGYGALELRYGWQTSVKDEWAKTHNYPTWGVGWYSGTIGDIDVLGNPNALYSFINLPVSKRQKRNQFELGIAMGIAYNLVPFDQTDNAINDAIGARFAVYMNLNIGAVYKVSREIDFLYGLDLTHFSNGRTVQPNYGLNMIGFNFGARYHFNRQQRFMDDRFNPEKVLSVRADQSVIGTTKKTGTHTLQFYQAFGTVQNKRDAGSSTRYITSSTVLEWSYSVNERSGFTVGFDLFVDPSVSDELAEPAYTEHRTTTFPSVHVGYDYSFWRMMIRLQYGTTITEAGNDIKDGAFLRVALKYDISEVWYTQFGLKTYRGATADWLELGMGLKLFKF